MKKTLSILMICLVVLSMFSMFAANTVESETNNRFRRKITVDNSGNAETLTDYQVFLNVTYDSDMQPDFDDLRFAWYNETSGQEVAIDYWLDKHVDSEYALIWVEVPLIRALGQEVLYMYYGDPDAVSGSNGEETFVFFDGFSTDTTSNYELWSSIFPLPSSGNPNEFSWDPNGWLFVNASIREQYGRSSNVHVSHKTAQIDAREEKYWLETRAKAFGTGALDHLGVCQLYKYDAVPKWYYRLMCSGAPLTHISSVWEYVEGVWEFHDFGSIPTEKDEWYRLGVGTSPNGTVIGKFCDDDYGEIETLVNQTIHQDNEWWVGLQASRGDTDTWATLHAYFDYLRVRKFTDPEPSYSIGPEEPLRATVDIDPDTLNLKSNGQWITAYITLPEGRNVEDIVLETVEIEGISAAWSEIQNGVYMVKFDRAAVQAYLTNEPDYESAPKFYDIPLTVTGELVDGTPFEGTDTIRVLQK